MKLVDVHMHLTHEQFAGDEDSIVKRAFEVGVRAIVVNGLEPASNRRILELCAADTYKILKPAVGIYPLDAVNALLPADFPQRVSRFDVDEEIKFIRTLAEGKKIVAVGECGLDGYYVDEPYFAEQERVFDELIVLAMEFDLPVIIHSRKREIRAAEMLAFRGAKKVDFHCFGGRTKHAVKWAEEHGWHFSIPANSRKNEAFASLLRNLPESSILTETDAPYLAPVRGERNESANVLGTIEHLAELRGWEREEAAEKIWKNCEVLFGKVDVLSNS